MHIVKSIAGAILGYAIFVASAVLIFRLTKPDPHAQQGLAVVVGSIVYGMFFGAVGGYVSAAIAGRKPFLQSGFVTLLIALGATVSLLAGPHAGPMWSRVSALTLMAPCALLGGAVRSRQGAA